MVSRSFFYSHYVCRLDDIEVGFEVLLATYY